MDGPNCLMRRTGAPIVLMEIPLDGAEKTVECTQPLEDPNGETADTVDEEDIVFKNEEFELERRRLQTTEGFNEESVTRTPAHAIIAEEVKKLFALNIPFLLAELVDGGQAGWRSKIWILFRKEGEKLLCVNCYKWPVPSHWSRQWGCM